MAASSSSWSARPTGPPAWSSSTATAATATPSTGPSRRCRAEGRDVLAWWPHAARRRRPRRRAPRRRCCWRCVPDLVRRDRAAAGRDGARSAALMARLRAGGVRAVSPNGVLGDPTGAIGGRRARRPRRARRRPRRRLRRVARGAGDDHATRSTARPAARPAHVVIGGSPLRLFRLTAGRRRPFDRIAAGEDVADLDGGRRHASSIASSTPAPSTPTRPSSPFTAGRRHRRRAGLRLGETPLAEIVRCCPGVADGHRRRRRLGPAGRPGRRRPGAAPAHQRRPGRRPQRRARRRRPRRSSRSSTPTSASSRAGSTRCSPTSPTSASPSSRHASPAHRAPAPVARYEQGHSPLDLGPEPGRIAPGTRLELRAGGGASSSATEALRSIGGFDRTLRFGEDVDAVWRLVEAGWRCRYEPAVGGPPPTRAARGAASSPSASPTARRPRRWPDATPARWRPCG